jgi:hypothetical protein
MIRYISKKKNNNLILLVHGFTGGKDTWIDKNGDRIPKYLERNKEINSSFDIAYYDYYTKVIDKIDKIRFFFGLIKSSRGRFKRNLSIDDIKDVLFSHLENEFKKYDKVVIIAHSMGGLISKAAILKLIEKDNNKIVLFLSLCVPHNGSNLANLGKLILNNPNLQDLAPLSKIIDDTTRKWLNFNVIESLPRTIYYQGKNDKIVPNQSSEGYEAREVKVVYSNDDHSSILSPINSDTVVIASIITEILDSLKKKEKTEKSLINAELSQESLDILTKKISNKLGVSIPQFENLRINKDRIPQLSANISDRSITIKNLLSETDKKWIAMYGMYDTGKTQLSILVSKHLNLETIWVSFKDLQRNTFTRKLFNSFDANTLDELEVNINTLNAENKILLVLDDLPKFGIDETVDEIFNNFISLCFGNNIVLFSTSNHILSSSIKKLHSDNLHERQVPLLSEKECIEVIQTYSGSTNFEFKELLYIITKGYPIYLQIVCRYLEKNSWLINKDKLLDFFTGKLFTDLTDETLSKLMYKVEDEQSRELLYRLNIVRTNITDIEIRIVSDCNPNIIKATEKVSQLTGSWLQRNGLEYIISPLIKRLGVGNLHKSLVYEINDELGNQLLTKGALSQFDVQHVIGYFINSKQFEKVGFVILNYLKHCISKPNLFFDWNFGLYSWYHSSLPNEMSIFLRMHIRSIQLNLEAFNPNEKEGNLEFLRNDLVTLVDEAILKKIDVYFPALVLSSSYLKGNSALAVKYFSYYINSYTYKELPKIDAENLDEFQKLDSGIVWLSLNKIDSLSDLNHWFENVEEFSEIIDESTDEQSFFLSDKLFLNFIVKEKKSEFPDWHNVLEIFKNICTKATELSLGNMKVLALKYQIIILSEMLDDLEGAESFYLQQVKKGSLKESRAIFLTTDELGKQFYYKGKNEKAEEYLIQIVSLEVEKYIVSKAETYLTLAKLVDITDAKRAHEYMLKGLKFITDNTFIDEISYIQFIGEFATSLYRTGKTKDSLVKFIEGYELLLDSFEENDFYINTQIRFGNAIGYLIYYYEHGSDPGDGFTEPYLGIISKNNDLTDLYFQEKLLINVFNIIHFFEISYDNDKAEYWAFKLFALKEEYQMKVFHRMLSKFLGYLVSNDRLDEAFKLQVEIIESHDKLLLRDVEQISNSIEKELVASIQSREMKLNRDNDLELMLYAFNPILIHLLKKKIKRRRGVSELVYKCKFLLEKYSVNFSNKKLIDELNYVLNNFPTNEAESIELQKHVNNIDQDVFKYVQVPTYLIFSIYNNSKTAIELHFIVASTFQLYEGSINICVLNPFLREFWQKRLNDNPKDFKNSRKFTENLQKTKMLKTSLQTKAIFTLAAENLDYKLKEEDKLWIKKYTDEYGE